jgi:hypothetical protein
MLSVSGALTTLNAASLVMKLCIAGGVGLAALAAYGLWHHEVYDSGWHDALASVARADAKTIADATRYRNAYKACHEAGKGWDQTTGACL